jgi:hypothetical protein
VPTLLVAADEVIEQAVFVALQESVVPYPEARTAGQRVRLSE